MKFIDLNYEVNTLYSSKKKKYNKPRLSVKRIHLSLFTENFYGDENGDLLAQCYSGGPGLPCSCASGCICGFTCGPMCLPPYAEIAVLGGNVRICDLTAGTLVWTVNSQGQRYLTPVKRTSYRIVPKDHIMIRFIFSDNRKLTVSGNHPGMRYHPLDNLKIGDRYNGAYLIQKEKISYTFKKTYDLLPEGETGLYWADNVLIGSTQHYKSLYHAFFNTDKTPWDGLSAEKTSIRFNKI